METIKRILENENISYNNITQSESGFTNVVYFVDQKYVVKVLGENTKPEKLHKEVAFYKNVNLPFIPKYICNGKYENCEYLIIEYISGKTLYNIWHTLDNNARKDLVCQICNILKDFHNQDYKFLDNKFIRTNWQQKWIDSFSLNIDIISKKGFDTTKLEYFAKNHLAKIMEQNKPCLIYNDAHFDNFILSNGKLNLIDFDRVLCCSKDYELLIISMMLDNPLKFANEFDEQFVDKKDYDFIYDLLKQNYSDMFDFEFLEERLFIYKFIYKLGHAYEFKHDEWIENELKNFEEFFKERL